MTGNHLRLEARQRTELLMSPVMQQAIKLLVMSTLELREHIEEELETNPTLEVEEPVEEIAAAAPAEAEAETAAAAEPEIVEDTGNIFDDATSPTEPAPAEVPGSDSAMAEIDYENLFSSDPPTIHAGSSSDGENENIIENTLAQGISLSSHLLDQLALAAAPPEVAKAAREVISRLDPDGFLRATAEEFAVLHGGDPTATRSAVELLKTFDPAGVAAVDAREALLIQLERRGLKDSTAWELVFRHLDELAKNRIPSIARAMNLDLNETLAAMEIVKSLEPRPGRAFGTEDAEYVVPDVIVEKIAGEWVVTLRNDRLPRVRVNNEYFRMYRRERKAKTEVSQYLKDKLDSAYLLIKSIEKRQNTVYRVAESIVKHQRDFFDYGPVYLRPMTLKVVADDIQVHESTVSRVTTRKYMQTPQGIFELKYFFTAGIGTESGEDASAMALKTLIEELVKGEGPRSPLSDQKISEALLTKGYRIARRTITKYREQLGILSARQRTKY